jgi:hypothetical protein
MERERRGRWRGRDGEGEGGREGREGEVLIMQEQVLLDHRKDEEGIACLMDAKKTCEELYRKNVPCIANGEILETIASHYSTIQNKECVSLYCHALDEYRRAFQADHHRVVTVLMSLGMACH